jgi:3-methyladenine DNA glycosylase/8-oxoguanine DNA glycosylase
LWRASASLAVTPAGYRPPMLTRRIAVEGPFDLRRSLAPLVASANDPTIRLRERSVVRAVRTPEGPATYELRRQAEGFAACAWGPGAGWALEAAPGLLGCADDRDGFDPRAHPQVARAAHARPGLRMIRSGLVADRLVPTILAQRVTAFEAARSWTLLVRRWGEPAPGPHGLLLPPSPARLAGTPYWDYHALGVDRARATTVIRASARIARLEEAVAMSSSAAMRRLTALPGLGRWTAALVRRTAAGDPDVVEVGDYHVKHHVTWALAGEPRGTDERMMELLAPFAGHRGRATVLLLSAAPRAPRYAARRRVTTVDEL